MWQRTCKGGSFGRRGSGCAAGVKARSRNSHSAAPAKYTACRIRSRKTCALMGGGSSGFSSRVWAEMGGGVSDASAASGASRAAAEVGRGVSGTAGAGADEAAGTAVPALTAALEAGALLAVGVTFTACAGAVACAEFAGGAGLATCVEFCVGAGCGVCLEFMAFLRADCFFLGSFPGSRPGRHRTLITGSPALNRPCKG